MHPAYSVIIFTTASGAGYGLLALLGLFNAFGSLPAAPWFMPVSLFLALGLVTLGLLSSTYHLGHPERAWRAFSQWRSSWLSREGVAAVATYVPGGLFFLCALFGVGSDGVVALLGLAASALAAITVYCTAMIYASLTTIRQWNNSWVVAGLHDHGTGERRRAAGGSDRGLRRQSPCRNGACRGLSCLGARGQVRLLAPDRHGRKNPYGGVSHWARPVRGRASDPAASYQRELRHEGNGLPGRAQACGANCACIPGCSVSSCPRAPSSWQARKASGARLCSPPWRWCPAQPDS